MVCVEVPESPCVWSYIALSTGGVLFPLRTEKSSVRARLEKLCKTRDEIEKRR